MAYKTTTLKTKTNDNVYPNVIGDNRKNAFVDSSTITHHFYDQTHKVGFQINNETNIKIQNSLQKPKGLTKTELVGVGTNGQENIEIGDNLTLANGKISATGGGSGGVEFNILNGDYSALTYTGTISLNKINILFMDENYYIVDEYADNFGVIKRLGDGDTWEILYLHDGIITPVGYPLKWYYHFITLKNSTDNVVLYLCIQKLDDYAFPIAELAEYLADKKILVNGNLHGFVPTYIAGEGGVIKIYYRTPGDSNINQTPDEYQDLSSFEISEIITPLE